MTEIDLSPGYDANAPSDAQCSYCPNYGYTSKMDSNGIVSRYCVDCIKTRSISIREEVLEIQEKMLEKIFGTAAESWKDHDRTTCKHDHKTPFKKREPECC